MNSKVRLASLVGAGAIVTLSVAACSSTDANPSSTPSSVKATQDSAAPTASAMMSENAMKNKTTAPAAPNKESAGSAMKDTPNGSSGDKMMDDK